MHNVTWMPLTPHEQFWIEVIRHASRGTDPVPTLARTQKLRELFSVTCPSNAEDCRNGHR